MDGAYSSNHVMPLSINCINEADQVVVYYQISVREPEEQDESRPLESIWPGFEAR